jgi:dipeptidase D
MAILSSDTIEHPPIEALFTIDEETGMTGAMGLKGGLLQGQILLNLDTEDDDELTIGCAGGIDVTASRHYLQEITPAGMQAFTVAVRGLTGGHSGMDIHRGRGNANKLMNRLLWRTHEHFGLRITEIKGGSLRNAIPRESFATVVVAQQHAAEFERHIATQTFILKNEYNTTDPNLAIEVKPTTLPKHVAEVHVQELLLAAVYGCPNGIHRMSPEIDGLVQTSNNLSKITVADGMIEVQCLTRGSVDSEKIDLARAIEATFLNIGSDIKFSGAYPGWAPKPDAGIVSLMSNLYRELFAAEPKVNACHAGLECGILGTNYPGMEMISFGPNIKGAHSPDERVQISSVQKFWKFLLETLKRIPEA